MLGSGSNEGTILWENLSDMADVRFVDLLVWVKGYYVDKIAGNDVISYEESVFLVNQSHIQQDPTWEATISLWSVWDQQDLTVKYRLALGQL